ncbi:MAG: tRNA epoxyqueuosine(34) reductase QueG [Verrucomicrobia bacterium]|nr:tRNA epoxyqueuosine(34) reductase QueG [Verrucomicrobiota bacterium]
MKSEIRALATNCGFDDCRFARVGQAPHSLEYFFWLRAGSHASMTWLGRDPARRADPSRVLLNAKTLLVLAKNYFQGPNPRSQAGKIARYAWGTDYHEIMLKDMAPIEALLREKGGRQKCYVDTGPILERDFAAVAGLSWQGKSTMCLNERLGTWFFIGVILTTLEFEADLPAKNRCGKCTRCIDVCPTRAITQPYQLDARRCISYLTIEHKGPIPIEFRSAMGDRIYGCDDCLDVCPWNRFAELTRETRFTLPDRLKALTLRQLAVLSDNDFRALFRNSPIKRIGRVRFVRNVCIALGNAGTTEDMAILHGLAKDHDPLIAEHASWAVEQIRNRCDRQVSNRVAPAEM